MLDKLELKTAVWIYDIDNFCITWANQAALLWWESPSLAELQSRDFKQESSQAVSETLRAYQKNFYENRSFMERWQFSPNGLKKEAYCRFSGVFLPDKRMGMLVEATPSNDIPQFLQDHTIAIMATFDMQGHFQSCNPPFENEFGSGKPSLESLTSASDFLPELKKNIARQNRYEADLLLKTLNGNAWFRASFTASTDASDNIAILCQLHNIDERKKRELVLFQQAHTDSLTGLLNRRGFTESIQPMLDEHYNTLIFYIDLDGFKMINDSLGHAVGDLVLKEVASRLKSLPYSNIQCCRFGGDEFVISLPDVNRQIDTDEVSATIVNSLSSPYKDDRGNIVAVSASIGVSRCPDNSLKLIELIRFADAAMYCSKKQGKKRSTLFVPGMEREILRKSILTQYLSKAITNNELSLHYQPIVNATSKCPHCFEALLRWYNSELGHVSPQELIEVAELSGQIVEIENWVLATALSNIKNLRKYTNSEATVAVNISSIHLVHSEFLPYLLSTLAKYNLTPKDLIIEITESVLLDDLNTQNNPLTGVSVAGINISIDDFGTGYSSLAYLHNIKASSVKIDRGFISASGNSVETLGAIHNLVVSLNMVSIVEGIETEEQANIASKAGITLHQGYWYARPQAIEAFQLAWLETNRADQ
jgi:diguanylate cyclase (GGDEF)-like protein